MNHPFDSTPIVRAEVIKVLHVLVERGNDTEDDPIRNVMQYWSLDGRFLAEFDTITFDSFDCD